LPETPGGNCTDLLEFKNKTKKNLVHAKKEKHFNINSILSPRCKELFERQQERNQLILESNAKTKEVIKKFNKHWLNKSKCDTDFQMENLTNVENLYLKRNIPKPKREQEYEVMKLEDMINSIALSKQREMGAQFLRDSSKHAPIIKKKSTFS